MVRKISVEEACRTEHLPDCLGGHDCECFSSRWHHAEIYKMQTRLAQLERRLAYLGDDETLGLTQLEWDNL